MSTSFAAAGSASVTMGSSTEEERASKRWNSEAALRSVSVASEGTTMTYSLSASEASVRELPQETADRHADDSTQR